MRKLAPRRDVKCTIDAEGLKLQDNAIIDNQVFREGDAVDISFSAADCVLLGEDDRRLM